MGDKRYRVGGTRGGQDQFKWDDVKSDVHRENYLGHSLLAPVGRWQRGKDLKWWNKKGDGGPDAARAQAEMEKARQKQLDEDLLNEALGLAPRKIRAQHAELTTADKKQLLEKGGTVDQDGVDTERVTGLGAGPANHHEHIPSLTLKERELARLERERDRKEGGLTEASLVEIVDYDKEQRELAAAAAASSTGATVQGASRKRLREEKRAQKRERKQKKRLKKENKKEKKLAKAKEEQRNVGSSGGHSRDDRKADDREKRLGRQGSGRNLNLRENGDSTRDTSRRDVHGDKQRVGSQQTRAEQNGTDLHRDGFSKQRILHDDRSRRGEPSRGSRQSRERQGVSSGRARSRSPVGRRDGGMRQIGRGRGARDSRERHQQSQNYPRNGPDSQGPNERDHRDDGRGKARARQGRRSPSSSGSSSSSSDSSSSGSGDSNGPDNRRTNSRRRDRSSSRSRSRGRGERNSKRASSYHMRVRDRAEHTPRINRGGARDVRDSRSSSNSPRRRSGNRAAKSSSRSRR